MEAMTRRLLVYRVLGSWVCQVQARFIDCQDGQPSGHSVFHNKCGGCLNTLNSAFSRGSIEGSSDSRATHAHWYIGHKETLRVEAKLIS